MPITITIHTAHGYLSAQPSADGNPNGVVPQFQYRQMAGAWGQFTIDGLDNLVALLVSAAKKTSDTPTPTPTLVHTPITNYQEWFGGLVAGRPFSQQTLLDLEPTLNKANVLLTPPNAVGDRTKIGIPLTDGSRQWVRVGFGEGHWVWMVQG